MTIRALATGLALLAAANAAAQEPFIKGVYLPSAELCRQAAKDGLESIVDQSVPILTARGLEAIEWNCRFLDVKPRGDGISWLVQAFCEEPDHAYPDLYALIERQPGRLEFTSLREELIGLQNGTTQLSSETDTAAEPGTDGQASADGPGPDDGLGYHFCEGVAPP